VLEGKEALGAAREPVRVGQRGAQQVVAADPVQRPPLRQDKAAEEAAERKQEAHGGWGITLHQPAASLLLLLQ